jgi:CBS domain-containing protein
MLLLAIMIYVTGHRNPDMDSICAAHCYAHYKNAISSGSEYRAIRCGAIERQTKYVFGLAGVEPPVLVADIHPRAQDIARTNIVSLGENEAVYTAIRKLDEHNISVLPIRTTTEPSADSFRSTRFLSISSRRRSGLVPNTFSGRATSRAFFPKIPSPGHGGGIFDVHDDRRHAAGNEHKKAPAILPKKPVLIAGLRKTSSGTLYGRISLPSSSPAWTRVNTRRSISPALPAGCINRTETLRRRYGFSGWPPPSSTS